MIKFLWENVLNKKQKANDVFHFLRQSYIFKDLNNNELEFVSQIVHIRQFRPGEKVFSQGDPGVGMYLLFSGTVDIIMKDANSSSTTAKNASEVFITRLSKGDFFGELSLVEEPSYRTASALSVDRCTLVGFFKPDLLQIIQRNPNTGNKICMRLAEILGRRLRETTEKVSELIADMKTSETSTDRKASHEKHFTS